MDDPNAENQSPLLPDDETPLPDPDPRPPSVTRARVTVVSRVYHQIPGEESKGPTNRPFYRWLDSLDQAYERSLKIGEDWKPLDCGWVERPALLVLANAAYRAPSRRPTDAELAAFMDKVLEVGIQIAPGDPVEPFGEIPVGEDMRLSPLLIERFFIRCRSGEGKYSIFLVPA